MYQTSNARNHEITEIKLSIGHCKLIGRLLDEKLREIEDGISDLHPNAFKALIDTFERITQETAAEKAENDAIRSEKFKAWASGDIRNVVKYG